jgi:hypothetical protein
MTDSNVPAIYGALDMVRAEIDRLGIAKTREVTEGVRFKFRGIDDVMNVFSGLLNAAKVLPCPGYANRQVTERVTAGGKPNYNTSCECMIAFISLVDGSRIDVGPFYGEANDTADKSTAKAQSIAYRQGMLTTFVVPLGPAMDPEADVEQQGDSPVVDKAIKDVKAGKPVKASKAQQQAKAELPEPGISVPENVRKVLLAKAHAAGLETETQLLAVHPAINMANLNDVLADLGKRAMAS